MQRGKDRQAPKTPIKKEPVLGPAGVRSNDGKGVSIPYDPINQTKYAPTKKT